MTEQIKRRKTHSEDHNIFRNYNGFLKHPCTIDISNIRIPAIYEICKLISPWDKKRLDNIPDTLIYIRLKKQQEYDENILLKSSMIEEQIHKHALSGITDLFNQSELNLNYYNCLNSYLKLISSGEAFKTPFVKVNFEQYIGECSFLNVYTKEIPDVDPRKSHLELYYTMLSFLEYKNFDFIKCMSLVKFTKEQQLNMKRLLEKENVLKSVQEWGDTIVHNGEYSNTVAKCAVCMENHADCMYSNCRHLCLCYECLTKVDNKNKEYCIICKQHNDCIIQTFSA